MQDESPWVRGFGSRGGLHVKGIAGQVVEIRDETLFVRFDGERWRYLPPVPVRRNEGMLDGEEHPAGLPRVDGCALPRSERLSQPAVAARSGR